MFPVDGVVAYVGLGSNLDSPVRQVSEGLVALGDLPRTTIIARSPLYRSAPMGPQDQPDYVNAVAALCTALAPMELLEKACKIEDAHGKDREGEKWGPRTLDLDILLFGDLTSEDPRLLLPHPGLTKRNFVVYPLLRVAPELVLPDGRALKAVARELTMDGLEEMKDEAESERRLA
jgi:2-amino-4-hydroxy-6-hydroxymethyldihydropteridine diphosphokinase